MYSLLMEYRENISANQSSDTELLKVAFGEVIERHRIDADFDQRPFSKIVGISNSHLRKIETGATCPTLRTVWKLASVLEVDPGILITEANEVVITRKLEQSHRKPPKTDK